MLIGVDEVKNSFIELMVGFEKFAKVKGSKCKIIDSANHPYLRAYPKEYSDILVFKFNEIQNLFNPTSREGKYYVDANSFALQYSVHFLSFLKASEAEKSIQSRNFMLLGLFSDFILETGQRFESIVERKDDDDVLIRYYPHIISNIHNIGMLNLGTDHSKTCYTSCQDFLVNIMIKEQEESNATKHI